MNGNKTLLVTCVYTNLYGSKFGGRHGRSIHYTKSLATITKLNQNIVVYTTEEDKKMLLEDEIIKNYKKIEFRIYNLYDDVNHYYYQKKIKDYNIVNGDRCYEIMHNKINWMHNHINEEYDYIYWIDAGLSHGGLFPIKYRGDNSFGNYFNNSLFTPKMIENLNKINDKIVFLAGNQKNHRFERNFLVEFNVVSDILGIYHIVGGLFGGKKELVIDLYNRYQFFLSKMIELDILETEENLLTLLLNVDKEFFHLLEFTTWHHEDSDMSIYNKENEIYFYNIFENLNL